MCACVETIIHLDPYCLNIMVHWIAGLTCNQSEGSSNTHQSSPFVSLEPKPLPSLFSTGWFQEHVFGTE